MCFFAFDSMGYVGSAHICPAGEHGFDVKLARKRPRCSTWNTYGYCLRPDAITLYIAESNSEILFHPLNSALTDKKGSIYEH